MLNFFWRKKVSHRILVMRKLKVTRQNIFISFTMKDNYKDSACIIPLQKYWLNLLWSQTFKIAKYSFLKLQIIAFILVFDFSKWYECTIIVNRWQQIRTQVRYITSTLNLWNEKTCKGSDVLDIAYAINEIYHINYHIYTSTLFELP